MEVDSLYKYRYVGYILVGINSKIGLEMVNLLLFTQNCNTIT